MVERPSPLLLLVSLLTGLAITPAPRQPSQTPERPPPPTFRVSEELSTIDAIVTDNQGQHVRDLRPEDFEVQQRGNRLAVRQVVYVDTSAATATTRAETSDVAGATPRVIPPPAGPVASTGQTNRRTIAVVVDDFGLSFESVYWTRRALSQFIDTQVEPGDLVAILHTAGGVGALQQLTTDKRVMRAAVDNLRWTSSSRFGIGSFTPINDSNMAVAAGPNGDGLLENSPDRTPTREGGSVQRAAGDIRNTVLTTAWLTALEFVIGGIESVPGRKAVVMFSEGFDLFKDRVEGGQVWHGFVRLMNRANKSGVVLYTIDPRGLVTTGLTAEDNPQPPMDRGGRGGLGDPQGAKQRAVIVNALQTRHDFLQNSQEVLRFMAEETGGLAIQNTNDLSGGLGRVLNDLSGYYLIGYEATPGNYDWENAPVHVSVTRKGLSIRSRQGSFGPAMKNANEKPAISDPLVAATLSPFSASALPVRLNAWFAHSGKTGYLLRSDVFLEGGDLPLTKGEDGQYTANLEIGEVIVGNNGVLPATARRHLTLTLTDDQYRQVLSSGLLYTLPLTLKDPGVYQMRAAVRDVRTGAVGSATQVMVVPSVGKGRLAMSGVVVGSSRNHVAEAAAASPDAAPDDQRSLPPGVFRSGSPIAYAFVIYDGTGGTDADALTTRLTLMQNGRALGADLQPVRRLPARNGVAVLPIVGTLNVTHLTPGRYSLEVTVDDRRCKCTTVQSADLEIR
jgi:VWFA-related protein